jgi:hypothetical protein
MIDTTVHVTIRPVVASSSGGFVTLNRSAASPAGSIVDDREQGGAKQPPFATSGYIGTDRRVPNPSRL